MAKAFLVVLPDEVDIFCDGDMGDSEQWLFATLQSELEHFKVLNITNRPHAFINDWIDELDEEILEGGK